MPQQISITWHLTPKFDEAQLDAVLHGELGLNQEPPPTYVKTRWRYADLTAHLYPGKLVVQLTKTDFTIKVVQKMQSFEGLTLDDENAAKVAGLLPVGQNALVCPKCKMPTISITAEVAGLTAAFRTSCGHPIEFNPPMMMFSNRIIPDLNIVIGNSLSMFLGLGFFRRFEVVLPSFLLHAIDQFLGQSKKSGAAGEIQKLQEIANRGEIVLVWFEVGEQKYVGPEDFERKEDDFILEQAKLTNSILLTADRNLSQKAALQQRPVVFVNPAVIGVLKRLVAP